MLTIGSELTGGFTLNTNAAHLARRLAGLGIRCLRQTSIPDDRAYIVAAIRERLAHCELLVITGGLGPTFDDCTLEAIAEATGRSLTYHPAVAVAIRRFYAAHRRRVTQAALRQAWLPQGGVALPNPLGTAPGLWLPLPPQSAPGSGRMLKNPELALGSRLEARGKNDFTVENSVLVSRLEPRTSSAAGVVPQPARASSPDQPAGLSQVLIALPGVPAEMQRIVADAVLPKLRRLAPHGAVDTLTLRTAGIVELEIEAMLKRLRIPAHVDVGLYPHLRMVDVRLTAHAASPAAARRAIARVAKPLSRALGGSCYGVNEETLEEVVGKLLMRRRLSLGVAESCTGGLVCDRLTNVPGSSRYLRGGVVAYHNDLKRSPLNVPRETLARYGAVSAQVAGRMAQGVRKVAGADIGLAITGIAGPTGAIATKPVGLVYLALCDETRTRTLRCRFRGDRASIKHQAAQAALDWLRRFLLQERP